MLHYALIFNVCFKILKTSEKKMEIFYRTHEETESDAQE